MALVCLTSRPPIQFIGPISNGSFRLLAVAQDGIPTPYGPLGALRKWSAAASLGAADATPGGDCRARRCPVAGVGHVTWQDLLSRNPGQNRRSFGAVLQQHLRLEGENAWRRRAGV